ncbi:NUDIX hydrolase [Candidatus Kaiserbacteria bacterium]|nr:NUDIX hydrolase [Candidatus Kaiserbacteria bacterium]
MEMHIIQKHILKRLAENKTLRYAQIKPPRVEGNQFSYHLKTLIRRGYVMHKNTAYALTTKGVHYSTQVTFEHFSLRVQPKITTLIVCKNSKGEYLAYTRNKQPFLGMDGFPYGKVHLGERVAVAAERELKEKAGISAELKQKGVMYLLVTDSAGEVIAHTLFHIFLGTKPKGEIVIDSPIGKIRWLSEKDLLKQNIMPGVPEVLRIAKSTSNALLFEEYEFEQA